MTAYNPKTLLAKTFLGALALSLLGAGAGYWHAVRTDPSGWSNLPYALEGAIYAYGVGLGLVAYWIYPRRRTPGVFNRLFFSEISAFFAVIFFSEPLRLDFLPLLPYVFLLIAPLLALGWAFHTLRPRELP